MKYLLILGLLFTASESQGQTKEELLSKIKELEKIVQNMSPSESRWKAEDGNVYYEISSSKVYQNVVNLEYDVRNFNTGNMFKDKATAQHYAKKRAARQRLELLALALNGGIVEFKDNLMQFHIYSDDGDIVGYGTWNSNLNAVLFKTQALAKKAIKLTSKEDLTTMFGDTK